MTLRCASPQLIAVEGQPLGSVSGSWSRVLQERVLCARYVGLIGILAPEEVTYALEERKGRVVRTGMGG